jgi:integrase
MKVQAKEATKLKVVREGPTKIIRPTIEAAWRRRAKGQRLVVADAECRGLALVVNPKGMTWRYDYKPRGTDPRTGKRSPTKTVTIGNPETHSPEAARTAANKLKHQVQDGGDPAAAKRATIVAAAERRALTMDRLVEDYTKALPSRAKLRGAGKPSTDYVAREVARVKAAVADMKAGSRSIADVGDREVRALLRATSAQPGAARHRFGALSRFFDWARDEGLVAANPCAAIGKDKRPKPIPARPHFLRPAELAELWKAAGEANHLEPVHRDFIRFLIAVPARRTEAATLRWEHLDLIAAEWTQPGTLTKNGDPHRLHLHPLALDVLRERHETAGRPHEGLVFPAPKAGKALTTFSSIKGAIEAKAGRTGWRLHDFRRSFASALGEAGIPETVADAVLNHRQSATRGGVLGVYQRAQRWPEQVKAMEAWGNLLTSAIEVGEPGVMRS